jgi:hypothetical protein
VKGESKPFKLMTIIDTNKGCYSTIEKRGYTLGSPYTILQYLYAYWIIYSVYESPATSEMVQKMISTLEDYIKNKATLKDLYTTECYGTEARMENVRITRWNDKGRTYLYRPGLKT